MVDAAAPRTDERGITLVETMVVLALMALVMVPILQVLQGGIRNERQATARIQALSDGAGALEWMTADVRSSTGFSRVRVGVSAGTALVVRTTSSGTEQLVEWRFSEDQLLRSELDSGGQAITEAVVLDGLVVGAAPSPVQLLDLGGRALDTSATSAVDLTRCTSLVRIQIQQSVHGSTRTHATDVAVRTTRQSGAPC